MLILIFASNFFYHPDAPKGQRLCQISSFWASGAPNPASYRPRSRRDRRTNEEGSSLPRVPNACETLVGPVISMTGPTKDLTIHKSSERRVERVIKDLITHWFRNSLLSLRFSRLVGRAIHLIRSAMTFVWGGTPDSSPSVGSSGESSVVGSVTGGGGTFVRVLSSG